MIFIYAIILGIILYVVDFIVFKFSKQKFSIIDNIDNILDKISGENIWVRLLIVFGIPFLFFYLTYSLPQDSFGYWVFMILGLVFVGYLGFSWLDTRNLSIPTPKSIVLFVIGIGIWMLGDKTGTSLTSGEIEISNDISVICGWLFIIAAVIVYRKSKDSLID